MSAMIPIVQLGPDKQHPFPLLITTTKKNNPDEPPLVENFRVEEMAWSDPIGAAMREARQVEVDARYKESTAHEPGTKPAEDNVALFVVAYPVPIIDAIPSPESESESTPVGCGALRFLEGEEYMEIKRMYAIPSVRGTGAALSILMALEYYAQSIGMKGLKLETGYLHVEAMKFYPRHGYVEIPRFGNYKDISWSHCYQKDF